MKLTEHFTLEEITNSQTAQRKGIDNAPNAAIMSNLNLLAARLEIVRGILGKPMTISSGYRSPALNAAVGGVSSSAHVNGLAADFICPAFGTPLDVCKELAKHADEIGFDQLIQEGTWVHIGFVGAGQTPRHQLLTANFNGGAGTTYSVGL